MVIIQFQKFHLVSAFWTYKRIIAERRKNSGPPLSETAEDRLFFFWNSWTEFFVCFAVPGIKTAIADHFKVFFRDMTDQSFYEVYCRDGFFYAFVIFMTIVMKSNHFSVIAVDPGGSDDRTTEISADIFSNCLWITFVWLCVNIETIFMI